MVHSAILEIEEDSMGEPTSLYCVEIRDYTQIIVLGSKHLYLLSHLTSHSFLLLFLHQRDRNLGAI